MRTRRVAIVGLGSGGSAIAVELAKAGVGHFTLIDHDRLELGNVARHACGISDLGRFKTKAVRDRMLDKNPRITAITAEIDINEQLDRTEQLLADSHLIIGATDGDRSRLNLNAIALASGTTAIFGRAISRAAGGDVLRVRPHQGPCVACLFRHFEAQPDEISRFDQARRARPDYVSDADVETLIQVGLSNDIQPIATMVVKLALLELSRGIDSGIASLEDDLTADLYVWANRREGAFRGFPTMGTGSRTPAVLRWYGARTDRNPDCQVCGSRTQDAEEDPIFAAAPG
jgi:molybdopterin-synthase adenylyltransferase